jgi:hypothetical protein
MIRLITVIGHGVELLPQFIEHYQYQVDEINIVVYISGVDPEIGLKVEDKIKPYPNVKILYFVSGKVFDWIKVTELYNKVKYTHPEDWWVVADIDEFHVYPYNDLRDMVKQCDAHGWELVRGGFIDRIGKGGVFSAFNPNESVFETFPLAGFFRYPMSKACPNKICVMKGYIEITSGQHYAKIDEHTTWRWQGWNHPLIAPYDEYSVQVHHFKWDETSLHRLLAVANVNEEYAFSDEYRMMYNELKKTKFKLNVIDGKYMFEFVNRPDYNMYKRWNKLINKIVAI